MAVRKKQAVATPQGVLIGRVKSDRTPRVAALKKATRAAKDRKENDTSVELLKIEVARPLEHLGPKGSRKTSWPW